MPLPLIFLIRHGETDWNADHRYQGQTDIPLNERGRRQAVRQGEALGELLSRRGLDTAAVGYVASPLARAVETMTIVRRTLGLDPDAFSHEPRLMEAHYGCWEGLTMPEIKARYPDQVAKRKADYMGFAPDGGETYAAVCDRAMAALEALPGPTVVVAHGGVSRVVRGRILGLTASETIALPVPQDQFHLIEDGRISAI
jgi:broad specificity phosphatase PhoE